MEKGRIAGAVVLRNSRTKDSPMGAKSAEFLFRLALRLAACALLFAFVCGAEDFHPVTHRRIAGVMGAAGGEWLVRPERESDERPDQALDAIGIQRGSTVADIGAGVGYFTWRLATRVGSNGLVYGEDIQQRMLDQLVKNTNARHLTNVHAVLGNLDDPKLPKN